jgi:hypothetical protein
MCCVVPWSGWGAELKGMKMHCDIGFVGGPRTRRALAAVIAAAAFSTSAGTALASVTFGQIDTFEDGTTMGWSHGAISPAPPTNIPTGGPGGADDNYLRNISLGGFGAASRHLMYNEAQWSGNFVAAGVTRITGQMANFGATNLHMRLAVQGGLVGSRWGSTAAVMLPAGSGWTAVSFDLTASAMSPLSGGEALATVLGAVNQFRILSAQAGASFIGDAVAATLGVDNLRAMRLPGDANFDGSVNLSDFNILASNFGMQSGATWQQADFNFDGVVNLSDFNLLAANFGQSAAGPDVTPQDWSNLSAVVPEPGLGGLFASVLVMCGRRRRLDRTTAQCTTT